MIQEKTIKIPLIYILSNGHSGSTLLDLLLGNQPGNWTMGEAQFYSERYIDEGNICGCGAKIRDCDFWRSVVDTCGLPDAEFSVNHFRKDFPSGKVLRYGQLFRMLMGTSNVEGESSRAYGQANQRLFSAVIKESEDRSGQSVRFLVDASKDPYRLDWLIKSGLFDVKAIHLVKDPRSYIYSYVKRAKRKSYWIIFRLIGRWILENQIFTGLSKKSLGEGNYMLISYENLASEPDKTLLRIGKTFGFEVDTGIIQDFRNTENHAISGNAMRWEGRPIRLDESWRNSGHNILFKVIQLVTFPLSRLLGFRD